MNLQEHSIIIIWFLIEFILRQYVASHATKVILTNDGDNLVYLQIKQELHLSATFPAQFNTESQTYKPAMEQI